PGAIAVLDVADPTNLRLIDLCMTAETGDLAPEGILYISADDSPTSTPLLITAFEVPGAILIFEITPRDPVAAR
ncbi:MAG: hypothetical protein VYC34_08020, partial [Planctomycetota bacterium]|nr:hypothetical protein [Planctomycetota bacterium]